MVFMLHLRRRRLVHGSLSRSSPATDACIPIASEWGIEAWIQLTMRSCNHPPGWPGSRAKAIRSHALPEQAWARSRDQLANYNEMAKNGLKPSWLKFTPTKRVSMGVVFVREMNCLVSSSTTVYSGPIIATESPFAPWRIDFSAAEVRCVWYHPDSYTAALVIYIDLIV